MGTMEGPLFTLVTAVRKLWESVWKKEGNEEIGGGPCRFTMGALRGVAWPAGYGLVCSCFF